MTSRELQALEHIDRNGNLLWMDCNPYIDAGRLFGSLINNGLIEKNKWSGKWMVTPDGRRELSR